MNTFPSQVCQSEERSKNESAFGWSKAADSSALKRVRNDKIYRFARLVALTVLLIAPIVSYAAGAGASKPHAKVIPLVSSGKDVSPVLSGPPETVTMKSGFVVLAPGKSVGKHSTAQNEELLVVLAGQGEMTFKDGSKLPVQANTALYCPPETEHNVTNTGTEPLRYVYVVASTK
jgi:mannose-6-phosphate isomerase-like protein (cupin superfamily)